MFHQIFHSLHFKHHSSGAFVLDCMLLLPDVEPVFDTHLTQLADAGYQTTMQSALPTAGSFLILPCSFLPGSVDVIRGSSSVDNVPRGSLDMLVQGFHLPSR